MKTSSLEFRLIWALIERVKRGTSDQGQEQEEDDEWDKQLDQFKTKEELVEFFTGFKPQEKGSREWRVKKKRGKLRESKEEKEVNKKRAKANKEEMKEENDY